MFPSLFGLVKVFYDGREVEKEKGKFLIINGEGKEFSLRLKNRFYDPLPSVFINDEQIYIARSFKWYEYIWMGLPILLTIEGGLLGVLIGFVALRLNGFVFRSGKGIAFKYLFVLALNIFLAFIYLFIVILLRAFVFKQ